MPTATVTKLRETAKPFDLTFTRIIDAPRALVWKAWTDPVMLARWWGPSGFTAPVCGIEPRPGGVWHIDMRSPDGKVYPCRGTYQEVVENTRLVYTGEVEPGEAAWGETPPPNCLHIVEFEDMGERTRLTVTMRMASEADRDAMAKVGVEAGWSETFERLAALLCEPLELTITRLIDAPPALVWKAWTDPEHAGQWGPEGYTVEYMTERVAPGVPWRARFRPEAGGRDLWQGGVYREVVAPERLVFTYAWDGEDGRPGAEMLITLTLKAEAGKTRLTLHQSGFPSLENRDGHAEGWNSALDSLARHIGRVAPPGA